MKKVTYCLVCGKQKKNWHTYCSLECHWKDMTRKNTGKKKSEEHKRKISEANKISYSNPKVKAKAVAQLKKYFGENPDGNKGEKNNMWKGDEVGYHGLHIWVKTNLGGPDECSSCKKNGFKRGQIHWANKDHKYRRVKEDWMRLCVKCHAEYDKKHKLRYV